MNLLTTLAAVFITLKLVGVVQWSWWLVLAPIWGAFALVAALFVIAVVLALVTGETI